MSVEPPARLASEDIIINAPMSYAGSAQRIFRLRRRARSGRSLAAITVLTVGLVTLAWAFITVWYLVWGFWLIPYRLLRRGARKRKAEALRHRELLGTIQGAAAASAAAIVAAATAEALSAGADAHRPHLRVDAHDRDLAASRLSEHYVAGRITEEELGDRLTRTYAALTRGDLERVLGDLPDPPAGAPGRSLSA